MRSGVDGGMEEEKGRKKILGGRARLCKDTQE